MVSNLDRITNEIVAHAQHIAPDFELDPDVLVALAMEIVDLEDRPEVVRWGGEFLDLLPEDPELLPRLFEKLGQLVILGDAPIETVTGSGQLVLDVVDLTWSFPDTPA